MSGNSDVRHGIWLKLLTHSWMIAALTTATVGSYVWQPFDSSSHQVLGLVLLIAALACTRIEFSFGQSSSGASVSISPLMQPLALAAITLRPIEAFLIGGACIAIADWKDIRLGKMVLPFNVANFALSTGIASLVVHFVFPHGVSLVLSLPIALVACIAYVLTSLMWYSISLEVREPGGGVSFFRRVKNIAAIDVMVAAVGTTLVLPYMKHLPVATAVFLAFQGISYFAMRIANSEQLQSAKNAHMQESFSRYLPESIVASMSELGQQIELGGEEREITVMFVDVRNFTAWAEKLAAGEIITQLNELLSELTTSIFETEGTLDKFTGDGLMAFWGAPVEHPDHAERAVHTALLMLQRLDLFNMKRSEAGLPEFKIGIGIHSGPAIVGNVGHSSRVDYTAIGDTVNLSARLESATKQHGVQILTSLETFSYMRGTIRDHFERLPDTQMKGKRDKLAVFAVHPTPPAAAQLLDFGVAAKPDAIIAQFLGLNGATGEPAKQNGSVAGGDEPPAEVTDHSELPEAQQQQ